MIIYSVLITSNYDGESLHLFTSLKKCLNFVMEKFEESKDLHELDFIDFEEMGLNYKNLKSCLGNWDNGYSWEGSIYTDYRTTISIEKHDTKIQNMYNNKGEF